MSGEFSSCIAFTLKEEGGFVNSPYDNGGATNLGVTRATLSQWLRRSASVLDVKNLTVTDATAVYEAFYWKPIVGDKLPTGVNLSLFDSAVNTGVHTAAVQLQQVLGFAGSDLDGDIGPITLARLEQVDRIETVQRMRVRQVFYYRSCAHFTTYGGGWLARADRRAAAAEAMVRASVPTT